MSDDHYLDPERFLMEAPRKDGSWWPEWIAWLSERSGTLAALPPMGAPRTGYPPFADAPGAYVLME